MTVQPYGRVCGVGGARPAATAVRALSRKGCSVSPSTRPSGALSTLQLVVGRDGSLRSIVSSDPYSCVVLPSGLPPAPEEPCEVVVEARRGDAEQFALTEGTPASCDALRQTFEGWRWMSLAEPVTYRVSVERDVQAP